MPLARDPLWVTRHIATHVTTFVPKTSPPSIGVPVRLAIPVAVFLFDVGGRSRG